MGLLLPPRRDLSSTYLISTSSISVCVKRASQHDRVCASVCVYSSVSVLCPWYACKCCDTITRSDGGVPCEVVNCLMWSGPRNVLQREISCLNMLYKWSARLWGSFKGVGFNWMLISPMIMNISSNFTLSACEKCFGLTFMFVPRAKT